MTDRLFGLGSPVGERGAGAAAGREVSGYFGEWREEMKGESRESYGFPSFPRTTPLGIFLSAVAAGAESVLVGALFTSRVSSAIVDIRFSTKPKLARAWERNR